MDPQAEQGVARGLREGRTEAWQALYDAFVRQVWQAVARQMGPYTADIPDVVQEIFLAAARAARRYDPERGTLGMWLAGIARRHVALFYRQRQRQDRVWLKARELAALGREVALWLEKAAPDPGDALAQHELAGLVRAALTDLPIHYETLLTAKYFDGSSVDDLARQESCSATAVRSKLARARGAFREAFLKRVSP